MKGTQTYGEAEDAFVERIFSTRMLDVYKTISKIQDFGVQYLAQQYSPLEDYAFKLAIGSFGRAPIIPKWNVPRAQKERFVRVSAHLAALIPSEGDTTQGKNIHIHILTLASQRVAVSEAKLTAIEELRLVRGIALPNIIFKELQTTSPPDSDNDYNFWLGDNFHTIMSRREEFKQRGSLDRDIVESVLSTATPLSSGAL